MECILGNGNIITLKSILSSSNYSQVIAAPNPIPLGMRNLPKSEMMIRDKWQRIICHLGCLREDYFNV